MSAEVIDLCQEKKECSILIEKITVNSEKLQRSVEEKGEVQLESPPRKKLKQDAISFPKLSKEEAFKAIHNEKEKPNGYETNGQEQPDVPLLSPSKENLIAQNENQSFKSPTTLQSKMKSVKSSPALTKEEKEKQRQEKERLKQERLKEMEERKRIKEEEKKKKEEERLQKLAEKEKRELEKKQEKEKKELERKEKEKQKEEERRKREEEKRKKDEQKEAERKAKEAEREKREAERKEKEDLKRQEEEKKRQKEEMEKRKKEKAANQFKSFFTKKTQSEKKVEEKVEDCHRFVPFQVKPNMTLAPCTRKTDFNKTLVDSVIEKELPDLTTYLEELSVKIANRKIPSLITRRQLRRENELKRKLELDALKETTYSRKNSKLQPKSPVGMTSTKSTVNPSKNGFITSTKNDVILLDDGRGDSDEDDEEEETSFVEDTQKLMLAKFLKFSENTRPPYYGTWRKVTKHITGRKPFGLDKEIFNYEVDSDEEWIDEPGEDCSDNGDDDEEDEKETEDDQDGFFVPHGYLSDDEGVNDASDDEENDDGMCDNDGKNKPALTKETADGIREQEKLKSKLDSFEVAFNKKVKPRKPVTIGILFTNKIEDLHPMLKDYAKVSLHKSAVDKDETIVGDVEVVGTTDDVACSTGSKRSSGTNTLDSEIGPSTPQTVPEEGLPFLIRLVHGNFTALTKMCQEFQKFWVNYVKVNNLQLRSIISKKQLVKRIQSISTRAMNNELGKICYTVNSEVLTNYQLTDLKLGTGLPEIENASGTLDVNGTVQKENASSTSPVTIPVSDTNGTLENSVGSGNTSTAELMVID